MKDFHSNSLKNQTDFLFSKLQEEGKLTIFSTARMLYIFQCISNMVFHALLTFKSVT